jgi:hypothetical protein
VQRSPLNSSLNKIFNLDSSRLHGKARIRFLSLHREADGGFRNKKRNRNHRSSHLRNKAGVPRSRRNASNSLLVGVFPRLRMFHNQHRKVCHRRPKDRARLLVGGAALFLGTRHQNLPWAKSNRIVHQLDRLHLGRSNSNGRLRASLRHNKDNHRANNKVRPLNKDSRRTSSKDRPLNKDNRRTSSKGRPLNKDSLLASKVLTVNLKDRDTDSMDPTGLPVSTVNTEHPLKGTANSLHNKISSRQLEILSAKLLKKARVPSRKH